MTALIRGLEAWKSTDKLKSIISRSDGSLSAAFDGGENLDIEGMALETIVEITAAGVDWEVAYIAEDDGPDLCIEPVLAWGRRLDGMVVPITPSQNHGLHDREIAYRRANTATAFAKAMKWRSFEEWFDEAKKTW